MENRVESEFEEQVTNNDAEHSHYHTFIHGFVKFDLGCVRVPGMGNFHVKSQYPRLKPKFERAHVEDHDLEALASRLLLWVKDNFETSGREEYFKELVWTTVVFAVYMDPRPELHSKGMDLGLKWYFWLWYNDDVLENAIENKIQFKELRNVTDQFQSVLTGKYVNNSTLEFESVPNYPIFDQLFNSLLQLHSVSTERFPNYENRLKRFSNDLERYFYALKWFCLDEIDGRYSEASFRTYRRAIAFFDGIADLVALIHGVHLSDEISNSLAMKRLLEIVNSFGGFANDLLGLKKEFTNGQKDNLIAFMVWEKKIPLDVAVRRVCELLANELVDYDLLKKFVLNEFDYDANLVKYLDILDSLVDGHNVMYLHSKRHFSVGSISLTR